MTTDDFTEAAEVASWEDDRHPDDMGAWSRMKFMRGAEWARTHLAAQEPADAAQIIDEHRTTGRWVGDGVRVECTCGHISPGSHPGGPQTAEDNAHRDADRKHAAHVADMLARSARRDEEGR